MGRVSEVSGYDAAKGEIRHDAGDAAASSSDHFSPPGDDSPPLAGDDVVLVEGEGTGEEHAVAYGDGTAKSAAAGEKRIYSRTPSGELAAEFWLKGDGSVVCTNLLAPAGGTIEMRADGTVMLNGVEISPTGSITVPSGATLGSAALDLLQHTHATAGTGTPSPPIPFAPP